MNEAKRDALIGALLREREGLKARGLDARVNAVDAELARLGYKTKATETKPAREKRPRKRASTR